MANIMIKAKANRRVEAVRGPHVTKVYFVARNEVPQRMLATAANTNPEFIRFGCSLTCDFDVGTAVSWVSNNDLFCFIGLNPFCNLQSAAIYSIRLLVCQLFVITKFI